VRGRDLGVDPGGAGRAGRAPHRRGARGVSVKEADRVLPATSGERAATRERRSVVKSSRVKQYEPAVIGLLSVLAALTAWQLVANARIWPPLFLPGPWEVGQAMVKLFQQGATW